MRSSVVLFILTFAVLGLLLGFAEVYNTGQEGQRDNMTVDENITANVTHGSDSGSKVEETGK
jgi:hypothetical protein